MLADGHSLLIDCGIFQGAETADNVGSSEQLQVDFPIEHVKALIVTHAHIDHVGRIPYLLAAGFRGKIYCSQATAELLPLVMEDALKVGFTRDARMISKFLKVIRKQLKPVEYGSWNHVIQGDIDARIKMKPAGHILGSAYIECSIRKGSETRKVIFSGDLGAPYTPLLPAPKAPFSADVLVLESTYGDKRHSNRLNRNQHLQAMIEKALQDRGVLLIPAFSVGRTQELLYEIEHIIHRNRYREVTNDLSWDELEIIIDSPLAAKFTNHYQMLCKHWDKEAKNRLRQGRHPLSFEQVTTINDHQSHLRTVNSLASKARPVIVIAASGMCNGGRIMNYLKALIEDRRNNILFVGYQAEGTPGRCIQKYGAIRGYVVIDHERYTINAQVDTISGYSAHADQENLLNFVLRMRKRPSEIRLVHGDSLNFMGNDFKEEIRVFSNTEMSLK